MACALQYSCLLHRSPSMYRAANARIPVYSLSLLPKKLEIGFGFTRIHPAANAALQSLPQIRLISEITFILLPLHAHHHYLKNILKTVILENTNPAFFVLSALRSQLSSALSILMPSLFFVANLTRWMDECLDNLTPVVASLKTISCLSTAVGTNLSSYLLHVYFSFLGIFYVYLHTVEVKISLFIS